MIDDKLEHDLQAEERRDGMTPAPEQNVVPLRPRARPAPPPPPPEEDDPGPQAA
jgi:hypothetical protein